MKKNILFLFAIIVFSNITNAQELKETMYVAAKQGVNVMSMPNVKSKVLGKVAYGQSINVIEDTPEIEAEKTGDMVDGLYGDWCKVNFKNKTGYIFSSKLFSIEPPKKGVQTLKAYIDKLSSVVGTSIVKNPGATNTYNNKGQQLSKKLYKNGAEIHEFSGHEYTLETHYLPGFSLQQAFLLVQLLPEYSKFISAADEFPLENSDKKMNDNGVKSVTLEKYNCEADSDDVRKIKISILSEEPPYETVEIYSLENGQAAISLGSGE